MDADPFFCLKIGRLKATVRRVPHRCKNWFSIDPADFATTRRLFPRLWQFAQWLGRPLAYRGRHSAICQGTLPGMPQTADLGGFYYDSALNLKQNLPDLGNRFLR
jgi:hypothetical protein